VGICIMMLILVFTVTYYEACSTSMDNHIKIVWSKNINKYNLFPIGEYVDKSLNRFYIFYVYRYKPWEYPINDTRIFYDIFDINNGKLLNAGIFDVGRIRILGIYNGSIIGIDNVSIFRYDIRRARYI